MNENQRRDFKRYIESTFAELAEADRQKEEAFMAGLPDIIMGSMRECGFTSDQIEYAVNKTDSTSNEIHSDPSFESAWQFFVDSIKEQYDRYLEFAKGVKKLNQEDGTYEEIISRSAERFREDINKDDE